MVTVTSFVAYTVPHEFETAYDIVVMPEEIPLTIPVVPTVPIAVLEDDHTPPDVAFESVVVAPVQTLVVPPLVAATVGVALTVTTLVAELPHETLYVIVTVPALTPVSTPVVEPIVARAVLLDDHVPPVAEFVYVVVAATHAVLLPPIVPGAAETVIGVVVALVRVPLVLHDPAPVQVITQ